VTSWNLTNAQKDLAGRQGNGRVGSIGDLAAGLFPGDSWVMDSFGRPVTSAATENFTPVFDSRGYKYTPLSEFRYDHLQPAQAAKLRKAVQLTANFIAEWRKYPGLSAVYAGSVGTGKTTMADNIKRSFTYTVNVLDHNDKVCETIPMMAGRIYSSSQMMAVLGGDYWEDGNIHQGVVNLGHSFDNVELIVVDDVGMEEIPYSGRRFDEIRQKRYGALFDWAYNRLERQRKRVHLVLTTMTPIVVERTDPKTRETQKVWNPDFVAIIGQQALTRLNQMARGYLVDLTGLPDYRPLIVDQDGPR